MLTSENGKQSTWRHFHALKFHTSYTAVAYALREAHRSIDAQLPAHPKDGATVARPIEWHSEG